ncbi:MAG TPA: dienelactone hydrolase family protein [Methylomirabilota bacterium]
MTTVAAASGVRFPSASASGLSITAELEEPESEGPSPTVLLLHSAGGIKGDAQWADYQQRLRRAGFASLLVDSYGPRGRTSMRWWSSRLGRERVLDAVGAIRYLHTLANVDKDRIAVIGASDGGRVALELVTGDGADAPPVNAVVAYYPACPQHRVTVLRAPVLVHEAAREDWPVRCGELFQSLAAAGALFQRVRYADARHGFDNPNFASRLWTPRGSLQYDAVSEREAWTRTVEFLLQHLGRR